MDSQGTSSRFYFDCTLAASLTIHFIHHQFSHLHISLHSFTLYKNPPMGPPPSTRSPSNLRPHRPNHITLGHLFLYLNTHPKLFFIHLVTIQSHFFYHFTYLFVVTFGDLLPFWQTQPMSPLVGALLEKQDRGAIK
jgi:hypothetical protein